MLVKFDSDAGRLEMFGDVAVHLLKAMGHTGTVPSALLPEDIPDALARLKAAVADQTQVKPDHVTSTTDEHHELPVSLKQRAFPLIELLERAAKRKCEIIWR